MDLSKWPQCLSWKIVLVLSRHRFIEKEAAQLCAPMRKLSSAMTGIMWYIKLSYRYHSVENKFLSWPL